MTAGASASGTTSQAAAPRRRPGKSAPRGTMCAWSRAATGRIRSTSTSESKEDPARSRLRRSAPESTRGSIPKKVTRPSRRSRAVLLHRALHQRSLAAGHLQLLRRAQRRGQQEAAGHRGLRSTSSRSHQTRKVQAAEGKADGSQRRSAAGVRGSHQPSAQRDSRPSRSTRTTIGTPPRCRG